MEQDKESGKKIFIDAQGQPMKFFLKFDGDRYVTLKDIIEVSIIFSCFILNCKLWYQRFTDMYLISKMEGR